MQNENAFRRTSVHIQNIGLYYMQIMRDYDIKTYQ